MPGRGGVVSVLLSVRASVCVQMCVCVCVCVCVRGCPRCVRGLGESEQVECAQSDW